jgi:peptidoglycan hydrolase-like protein with peptidoglycan-binding domain
VGKLRNLKVGSTGPDVKAIQEALNLVGDASASLKEDGIFGPKTDKAVRANTRRITVWRQTELPDQKPGPLYSRSV